MSQQHDSWNTSKIPVGYIILMLKRIPPLTFVERKQVDNEIMNAGEQHLAVHNKMIVMFPRLYVWLNAMDKRYILAGNINDITFGVEDK